MGSSVQNPESRSNIVEAVKNEIIIIVGMLRKGT